MNKLKKILIFFILSSIASIYSQNEIDTIWSGHIEIMTQKIGIRAAFYIKDGKRIGFLDIPEQGAILLELEKIKFKNQNVYFELPVINAKAIFDGKYWGDSISGKFSQSGIEGTFLLIKGTTEQKTDFNDTIPQPYNSEEITFYNDGNSFSGTITYPKDEGKKFPAVIMITGSGPQNRDEEIFGFKIFKIIAEHLTKNGIAVLRYDDRGTGGSKGKTVNESTTEDFGGDVIAALEYLKTKEYINQDKIGLIGHSEGGIVAPLAAAKSNDFSFLVLIAGTGVKGIDILKEQSKLIMQADSSSEEEINGYIAMIDLIYETLNKDGNIKELEETLKKNVLENYEKMTAEQKKSIKDKDEYVKQTVKGTINQFGSTWFRYFLNYDPIKALEKINIPVLMIFGEKDLQVSPNQNQPPMEEALRKAGNTNFKTVVFPNANHLFQEAVTGSPSEYSKLPKEFVPGFLEEISNWINQTVNN